MTQQLINVGAAEDDGTGDTGRAGGIKINANFTELYTFAPSAALLTDGSVDSTGMQTFKGHIGIGAESVAGTGNVLSVKETITDIGAGGTLVQLIGDTQGSPAVCGTISGFSAFVTNNTTPTLFGSFSSNAKGATFAVLNRCTKASAAITGALFSLQTSAGSGVVTNAIGLDFDKSINVAPTNVIGIRIPDWGSAGTFNTGLQLAKQTGATTNTGMWLNGDGAGADVTFGLNKEIRQSFSTNLDFSGSGIAHTAQADTPVTGYVTISINGTPRKLAVINP